MNRRVVALGIVATLGVILAFLALRSSPYLQYIPWMPRRIGVWADHNGIVRNVVAFFALGFALFLLVGRGPLLVLGACAFATAVEVAQLWIPGRIFDWNDIVASIAGILLAWPLAWLCVRFFGRWFA